MLDDLTILIVEDEALIGMEISMTLEDHGAAVVGPCMTVSKALQKCEDADAAVLDVDVRGEAVFPVADALVRFGKPFVFHTGRSDTAALRARYGDDITIIPKPANIDDIGGRLAALIRRK